MNVPIKKIYVNFLDYDLDPDVALDYDGEGKQAKVISNDDVLNDFMMREDKIDVITNGKKIPLNYQYKEADDSFYVNNEPKDFE